MRLLCYCYFARAPRTPMADAQRMLAAVRDARTRADRQAFLDELWHHLENATASCAYCTVEWAAALASLALQLNTEPERLTLAKVLCSIAVNNTPLRSVLRTRGMHDAVVALARAAETDDTREHVAGFVQNAVTGIVNAPCMPFVTPDMRDAFVAMARVAGTSDAREWIAHALGTLVSAVGDAAVADTFVDDSVRDAFLVMARHVSNTDECITGLARMTNCIHTIVPGSSKFSEPVVLAALVAMAHAIRSDVARKAVAGALCLFAYTPSGASMCCTPAVRDALVALAHAVGTDDASGWVASAMYNVVGDNSVTPAIFLTVPVRDALVALAGRSESDSTRLWVARAIDALVRLGAGQPSVLRCEVVRDACVAMLCATKCDSVCDSVLGALSAMTIGDPQQSLCGTECVRDALICVRSMPSAAEHIAAIVTAVAAAPGGRRTYGTDAVRDMLVAIVRGAASDVVQRACVSAMSEYAYVCDAAGARLYGTEAVRDAVLALMTTTPGVALYGAIVQFLSDVLSHNAAGCVTFCTGAMCVALARCAQRYTHDGALNESVVNVLHCVAKHDTNCAFLTPDMYNALSALFGCIVSARARARLDGLLARFADVVDDDDMRHVLWLRAADATLHAVMPERDDAATSFFTCVTCGVTRLCAATNRHVYAAWYACNGNQGRCRAAMCHVCRIEYIRHTNYRCTCGATTPPASAMRHARELLDVAVECPAKCGTRVPLGKACAHLDVCAKAAREPAPKRPHAAQ